MYYLDMKADAIILQNRQFGSFSNYSIYFTLDCLRVAFFPVDDDEFSDGSVGQPHGLQLQLSARVLRASQLPADPAPSVQHTALQGRRRRAAAGGTLQETDWQERQEGRQLGSSIGI